MSENKIAKTPADGEPVAWLRPSGEIVVRTDYGGRLYYSEQNVYTAPPKQEYQYEVVAEHANGTYTTKRILKREWVGLTDDEMQETGRYSYCRGGTSEKLYHIMWNSQPSASVGWCRDELIAFARAIEQALKEKNGG